MSRATLLDSLSTLESADSTEYKKSLPSSMHDLPRPAIPFELERESGGRSLRRLKSVDSTSLATLILGGAGRTAVYA